MLLLRYYDTMAMRYDVDDVIVRQRHVDTIMFAAAIATSCYAVY